KTPIAKIASVGMGPSTSPVLADGVVVLQCDEDEGKKSFIAGVDKKTGKELWRTARPVQAGWSTPLVVKSDKGTEVVASGFEWIISYEPKTGKELWRAKSFQSNALPTPLTGFGMVYVYSGYPTKKTFAIKLGGSGDVTATNVAWSYDKGTAYIPSSILYGDNIYLMTDRGILTCLDAKTGKLIYEGGRTPVP
ncbi:MAG: PQQ-like beta-propeller repeat protein, partial [Blastocatellia bacterium]|nr:PQQ-like beta-propeller repeat protein [Blastocatellia bacterium]